MPSPQPGAPCSRPACSSRSSSCRGRWELNALMFASGAIGMRVRAHASAGRVGRRLRRCWSLVAQLPG
ncbi:MAG: hypothetical protein MZV64_15225 [Ignavibacteriales bacterium]|nr:hypothetical protein [Ignavibacteriales bacterium]